MKTAIWEGVSSAKSLEKLKGIERLIAKELEDSCLYDQAQLKRTVAQQEQMLTEQLKYELFTEEKQQ